MIVYIREQGAKIRREGERLIVGAKSGERVLFAHQLEQLILFGNVHMTAQARSLLLAKKIDTVFLSSAGSYRGRLGGGEGENVFLRKRQFELLSDAAFQLKTARAIVIAKLRNQAATLARLKREHGIEDADKGVDELRRLEIEAREAPGVDILRGLEGSGAVAYFKYYGRAFHQDWGFEKRVRRPPTDPVNVVLSFVYTMLADRCHSACRLAGLDPYPAHLHTLEYGRMSLPLDLMEEFRAIFADAIALSLFNRRILKKEDFERKSGEDGQTPPINLLKSGIEKIIDAFAKKLAAEFRHPQTGERTTYERVIHAQGKAYRDAIEEKVERYEPFIWNK